MKSSFFLQFFIGTLLFAVFLVGLVSCNSENLIARRNRYLSNLPKGMPIKLAVVWSRLYGDSYYKGVQMAVKELNAAGGIAYHPVKTLLIDQFTNVEEARQALYPLSEDMNIAFALGFFKSEITDSLIQLTQYYGLPALINSNAEDILKNRWAGNVFRGTVTTYEFGRSIYNESIKQGVKNVIICYSSEKFTASIAASMIALFRENNEVDTQIYRIDALTNEWQFKLKDAINDTEFQKRKTAAVILMNDLNAVKQLASILAEGNHINLLFSSYASFSVNFDAAQEITIKLKIPLIFPADMVQASLKTLAHNAAPSSIIKRFMQKNGGKLPNSMLLYGYEQTMAVAKAMAEANSVSPTKVSTALKNGNYKGVMQTYTFTSAGELKHPKFYLITIRDGKVSLSVL